MQDPNQTHFMDISLAQIGNALLVCILMAAGLTFWTGVRAYRNARFLPQARAAMLGTIALTASAMAVLGYAFWTHDFSIRYVAHYSDRTMPDGFLVAALWGGQDGSLLWWIFLLSVYVVLYLFFAHPLHKRFMGLTLSTLSTIYIFFCILMLFAANPFSTSMGAPVLDGQGLNPQLQNYWMTIHPPCLYMGLIGWSIPFAICIAALIEGKLDEMWLVLSRRWVILAWAFLSLGNLLGMFWSYEELGWGGYWAWDPVENASFLPWLTATAYLHSTMIEERRKMLRVWNVSLLLMTFTLTIFGTFLTRSGLISSVHSFAKTDIGNYFIVYLSILSVVIVGLVAYRLPRLWTEATLESMLSREFAFVLNNWILLGMPLFILGATTYPLLTEWIQNQTANINPPFYNFFMKPASTLLLFLMGVSPLLPWRKPSSDRLLRDLIFPSVVCLAVAVIHITWGPSIGRGPWMETEIPLDAPNGAVAGLLHVLRAWNNITPVLITSLGALNVATIVQEFYKAIKGRRNIHKQETAWKTVSMVLVRSRKRYGGYVVHIGIVLMMFGFLGAAYDMEQEAAMKPGDRVQLGEFEFEYLRSYSDADSHKRRVVSELRVRKNGEVLGVVDPQKWIYRTHPQNPTTEVSIRSRLSEDLYVIMNRVNPDTKIASFKFLLRPWVLWIWIGGALLLLGVFVSAFPSLREFLELSDSYSTSSLVMRTKVYKYNKQTALSSVLLVLTLILTLLSWFMSPGHARADALHAGVVHMQNPEEKKIFDHLLCGCGDCDRLTLSACACGWAENMREEVRAQVADGKSREDIYKDYELRFGRRYIAVPKDEGVGRAIWLVPMGVIAVSLFFVFRMGKRWTQKGESS